MIVHIDTQKAKLKETGRRVSWEELSERTGIRRATLHAYSTGKAAAIRFDHIDALCVFFGCTVGELLTPEPVALPLGPIRPDRHGRHVGERNEVTL